MRSTATIVAALCLLSAVTHAEPAAYRLDATHADLLFAIDHLGFSTKHGAFRELHGALIYDAAAPQHSQVSIDVNAASIDTNDAERDADLKSDGFFDVEKFPELHFESRSVSVSANGALTIAGTLTMHGVTQPLTLQATLHKRGMNPFTRKPTVGFSAKGALRRSDYGITKYVPGIADTVRIEADVEFIQQ